MRRGLYGDIFEKVQRDIFKNSPDATRMDLFFRDSSNKQEKAKYVVAERRGYYKGMIYKEGFKY